MARLTFITPFVHGIDCLSIGEAPSQGLVYAIDSEIVIKLPFQYIIPDELSEDATFYLNHGVRSFVAMEREWQCTMLWLVDDTRISSGG
ncbi:hypothetical protein ONS95_005268 [Cadophora gregata]|uniref:uncharacterized protein n=1 Tax=Cadophora gregata TaxID=51156 RepID=UPI0026DACAF2|nr:uncharacterized protein ONS95_005268 [Cadophora gregata]KAK0103234.1 hypothetical protein ONS95_005268 [Cadophora gregata]KAK0107423.1 hypothetical protein ONS96_003241 [Cadophora gregata f. sp. sojae]